jgi:hypothetical protein
MYSQAHPYPSIGYFLSKDCGTEPPLRATQPETIDEWLLLGAGCPGSLVGRIVIRG